jgi:hypothetical protein
LGQAEKFLFRRLNAFRPYMMESDPVFDRTNVERVLGKTDAKTIDESLFRYALDTFFRLDRTNGSSAKAANAAPDQESIVRSNA